MTIKQKYWKWLVLHSWELWIAFIISSIAATTWLDEIDCRVSDWIYQSPGQISSDIVVIGIDSETLSKFGPLSAWLRRDVSKFITYLNEHDYRRERSSS